jgi:hypothetical protein
MPIVRFRIIMRIRGMQGEEMYLVGTPMLRYRHEPIDPSSLPNSLILSFISFSGADAFPSSTLGFRLLLDPGGY